MKFNDRNHFVKKPFNGKRIPEWLLGPAFSDAWDVCYNQNRSHKRNIGALFHAVFIGKLGEHILCEYLRDKGYKCYRPDYYINNEHGDNGDLVIKYKGKSYIISVKTCTHYGHFLVESVRDYNEECVYVRKNFIFDRHYLIRVNKNISQLNYNVSKEELWETIKSLDWKGEITGFITHEDMQEIIRLKMIIPKNDPWLKLSRDSYFIQASDMRDPFKTSNETVNELIDQQSNIQKLITNIK